MLSNLTSLVVEIGNFNTRVGYSGDQFPLIDTNSYVVSSNTIPEEKKYFSLSNSFCEGQKNSDIQSIFNVTEIGNDPTLNECSFQHFLKSIFVRDLSIDPQNFSILLSEELYNSETEAFKEKLKISQLLFERFSISNIAFCKKPILACFGVGKQTALVVDSGQLSTKIIAVHNGYTLNKTKIIIPYGGRTMDMEIEKYCDKNGFKLFSQFEVKKNQDYSSSFLEFKHKLLIKDIKQHISAKKQVLNEKNRQLIYQLPDKTKIKIGVDELDHPLINNSGKWTSNFENFEYQNLGKTISNTIFQIDLDIRKNIGESLLLIGGNLRYLDVVPMSLEKVNQAVGQNVKMINKYPLSNKHYAWVGGSILSSTSGFQSSWIGRKEWQELGGSILEKKNYENF